MRTCALLLPAAIAAAAFASMCHPAQAVTATPPPTTIAGICQAAHDADSRVSATFCSTLLKDTAPGTDTRYVADSAAAEGVSNAKAARLQIVAAVGRNDDGAVDDPIYRSVLVRCERSYSIIWEKYDAARQAITDQKYGDVEEELSSVSSIGQSCDDEFAALDRRDVASPFVKYSEDNTQIALLTVAITSLIKQ